MARHLRLEYAGAIYHVPSRGNERSDIFSSCADKQRFPENLVQNSAMAHGLDPRTWPDRDINTSGKGFMHKTEAPNFSEKCAIVCHCVPPSRGARRAL